MAGLMASEAAAFRDATVAFLGGKLRCAARTSREIHRAGIGAGSCDADRGGSRGDRGSGLKGGLDTGVGSRLSILAAALEF